MITIAICAIRYGVMKYRCRRKGVRVFVCASFCFLFFFSCFISYYSVCSTALIVELNSVVSLDSDNKASIICLAKKLTNSIRTMKNEKS